MTERDVKVGCFLAFALVAGALNRSRVEAQPADAGVRAFEVASVKPNKSQSGLVRIGTLQGRFTATNATLRMLVQNAYGVQDFRMSGGPGWIDTDRFNVEAKSDAGATFQQTQSMLKTLLEERFQLKVHTETRELRVYALIVARGDGQLGAKLLHSGPECRPITTPPGIPAAPPPPPGPAPAGGMMCPSMLMQGNVSGRNLTMERLATTLSPWVNRQVVDRTKLAGSFDMDLQWAPDQTPFRPSDGLGAPRLPVDPNLPSLFTALQEQLGLKLTSERGMVDVLVIDRAERPAED